MRITPQDRDIIARCGLHADLSLSALTKLTSYHEHTVRYALERFQEASVIRKIWIIDTLPLGMQRFHFHFSTAIREVKRRKELIKLLINSTRVAYFAETAGKYDFKMSLLYRHASEVVEFLETLTEIFGDVFFEKDISLHRSLMLFPRKYLAKGKFFGGAIVLASKVGTFALNELDHKILENLALTPDVTKKKLSEVVNASLVTIDARLKRLKERKILNGAIFSFQGSIIGNQNFELFIQSRRFDKIKRVELLKFATEHANVTNYRESFGGADFQLGAEVEHHDQLILLKESLYQRFGDFIASMQIHSRFRVHKYMPYPFKSLDELVEKTVRLTRKFKTSKLTVINHAPQLCLL